MAASFAAWIAHADEPPHSGHELGTVHFPVSCQETAQAEFDHAVALLHHMTYAQARESFEQVATTDAHCAMAHWGIAMTLFQPLWPTRPSPAELQRGWAAVERARSLGAPTERERLFIAAAEAFFLDPQSPDYWLRIRRWEEASQKPYAAYPDDPEAAVFYALALLATTPPGTASHDHADRAAEILLQVYRQNPDHPGAMHYLIHANDTAGREHDQLDITHRYETVAPDNPHALHMPTHIYTRLGDWDGVIRGNLRAADAALRYPAGDRGQFVWDEFPHTIEYLVYAYLQEGEDRKAAAQIGRLRRTRHLEPSFKTAFHLASTQARYVLERHAWNEAALIRPREPADIDWDRFPWPEAIARFAHGVGAARLGKLDEAESEIARLDALEGTARQSGEELFASNIRVLRLELGAWFAHMNDDPDESISLMQQAAELETSTPKAPVTPAPTIPAHEQLGDLLMELRRPAEALAAYRQSLALYPNRRNSLRGVAAAAQAATG